MADGLAFETHQPKPKQNRITKLKNNIQMNNKDLSAETKADSSTTDDVATSSQTIANAPVGSSLSYKEKFELANDFYFSEALLNAWDKKPALRKNPFQTIGDRIVLIEELEKQGFKIVKVS